MAAEGSRTAGTSHLEQAPNSDDFALVNGVPVDPETAEAVQPETDKDSTTSNDRRS